VRLFSAKYFISAAFLEAGNLENADNIVKGRLPEGFFLEPNNPASTDAATIAKCAGGDCSRGRSSECSAF